jgi:hypothetical protein
MHFGLKDVITVSIAMIGAVLGIINTWFALDQRRIRLRVVPKSAHPVIGGKMGNPMGCIEVVNLSAFPVSISEIGFTIDGDPRKHRRLAILQPITSDNRPLARTLEPRHGVTGYFDIGDLTPDIQKAYVRTECGEVAYGSSPALKQIRQAAKG